ncbi:MAG: hypothetical protein AAF486_07495 [Pseudomonadota bacterium]
MILFTRRLSALLVLGLSTFGVGGCASGMGTVRETLAAAPDWYQDRAQEVRGEGYPSIGRIPSLDAGARSDRALQTGLNEVVGAEELFRLDPRAVPPGLELDTMIEWADAQKRAADAQAPIAGGHLTDADLAALRALFEAPRATS